jgi:hypothetical protein
VSVYLKRGSGALLSAALKGDQVEGRTIGVVVFRAFLQIM